MGEQGYAKEVPGHSTLFSPLRDTKLCAKETQRRVTMDHQRDSAQDDQPSFLHTHTRSSRSPPNSQQDRHFEAHKGSTMT